MWIIVVGYGFSAVWAYAMTPGTAATAAARWPSTSFSFDRTRPNLVTVLHPECVCSKATLEEVSRLTTEFAEQLTVFVVVDASATGTDSGAATTLLKQVRSMPGVRLIVDTTVERWSDSAPRYRDRHFSTTVTAACSSVVA